MYYKLFSDVHCDSNFTVISANATITFRVYRVVQLCLENSIGPLDQTLLNVIDFYDKIVFEFDIFRYGGVRSEISFFVTSF